MKENWILGRVPRAEEPDTCLIGSGYSFWGRVVGSPGDPAEPKARLIAAAPDLLERLTFLLAAVERGEVLEHHVTSAKTAIAKATGQNGV